jgi:RNA polymerase subunit RPABC4/transcription elongation factor Spt4
MATERRRAQAGRRSQPGTVNFCPACGEALKNPTTECPHCGATILLRATTVWSRLVDLLPHPTLLVPLVLVVLVCGGGWFWEIRIPSGHAIRAVPVAMTEEEPGSEPVDTPAIPAAYDDTETPNHVPSTAQSEISSSMAAGVQMSTPVVATPQRAAVKPSSVQRTPAAKKSPPPAKIARAAVAARVPGPSLLQVRSAMNRVKGGDSVAWQQAANRFIGKRVRWRGRVVSIEPENSTHRRLRVDMDRKSLLSVWDVEGLIPIAAARRLSPGDEVIFEGVIRSVDWSFNGMTVELSRGYARKSG